MDKILYELESLNLQPNSLNEIQSRNGVYVFSVSINGKKRVVKYFDKSNENEVYLYKLLDSWGIPTIEFFETTNNMIVLEDIKESSSLRLGYSGDLGCAKIAKATAKWVRKLHDTSEERIHEVSSNVKEWLPIVTNEQLYSIDSFFGKKTFHNINEDDVVLINGYVNGANKVLIHNDFYSDNLAVNIDNSDVTLFDYNYMVKSVRSTEIHFICKVLTKRNPELAKIFLKEYGEYDSLEYSIFELYNHLSCLQKLAKNTNVPDGAIKSIDFFESGKLSDLFEDVIRKLKHKENQL